MAHTEAAQSASAVLMIRPAGFRSNEQTAATNTFQRHVAADATVSIMSVREFDTLVDTLVANGVEVHALAGNAAIALPDEVFPNNWLSTHADGTLILYPMLAENRRLERRSDIIDWLREESGFFVRRIVDLTHFEQSNAFLEGTGSLVLDRANRVAYAAISPRTHPFALARFAEEIGYRTISFAARDRDGGAIYHTNVLMSIGTGFALICSDSIEDLDERRTVIDNLLDTGRKVIEISIEQTHEFAGNALELATSDGPVIAISERALASLDPHQRRALEQHGKLVTADVSTIETHGGGSIRCMLAELYLPRIR